MAKHAKNNNFTDCEIEVLTTEVEARKCVLFGGLSSRISNKRKSAEWKTATKAVNAVGLENRTMADIKKKWSEIKLERSGGAS